MIWGVGNVHVIFFEGEMRFRGIGMWFRKSEGNVFAMVMLFFLQKAPAFFRLNITINKPRAYIEVRSKVTSFLL